MNANTPPESGEEVFDVVDERGRPVGRAPRRECHSNPALIHPAVHVFVFDRLGRLLLQRRSPDKDIQPGRWDTSVGGHLRPGEDPAEGARREMAEELGIAADLRPSHEYLWRSDRETEYVRSFIAVHDGPFRPDPVEIADAKFWAPAEIEAAVGRGVFTSNFEHELGWLRRDPAGVLASLVAAGRLPSPRPFHR